MSTNRGVFLFLARGGMELCWLYACATFLLTAIVQRPFPLPEAIGTFLLAATLNQVVRGMSLRVISVLGLQTMGFFLAASRIVYTLNYRAYSYFDKGWILQFLGKTRDSQEWLILVIILILTLVFWLGGATFARRSSAYISICIRFDYGVVAFFCLFILKSFLLVKGGIEVRDSAPMLLLLPFFIFSLLAIGLARNSDKARRNFLAGYRGIGMLVSVTVVILALGAGLTLIFMTYLSSAAEASYGVLKSAAGPLLPILERVLLFLFGKLPKQNALFPSTNSDESAYIPAGESSGLSESLAWGLFALVLLIALVLCALGMRYLLRWLFSRTSKEEKKDIRWQLVLLWVRRFCAALGKGFKWAVQRLKVNRDAVQLYRAFLKWGRHSGLPHHLSETPSEYGSRLQKQFPALIGDIGKIVEAFNFVVYGEQSLDSEQMSLIKCSWKRLCSSRYWPARLRSWFFQERT